MKTVSAKIGTTTTDLAPGAAQFATYRLVISKDGVDGDPIDTAELDVEVNLDPGTYVATVSTLDTTGAKMGADAVSNSLVLEQEAAVTFGLASTVTLSVVEPTPPTV